MDVSVQERAAIKIRRVLRFQRFPTHSTLYVVIVIRERDQAIIERRRVCSLSPRGRFYTCLIRLLIGQARVRHAAASYIHIDMSSQPKDQANQHPPVQRSDTGNSEIQSTAKHSAPEQVRDPPALIAYVIYLPYSA